MKRVLVTCLILLSFQGFSQITLNFQSGPKYFEPIKLTNNETKYYLYDQPTLNNNQTFSLYNLNGSLYKTIQMPPKPNPNAVSYYVQYISRTLFDNDPSNIEYIITYQFDSLSGSSYPESECKVIREDGTVLFDEMYGRSDLLNNAIYTTEEGTELMLLYSTYANGTPCPYETRVFNLPGELPASAEDKSITGNSPPVLFPNPNKGSFFIKMNSNPNQQSTINLYSQMGILLNTYHSEGNVTHINNPALPSGYYFINTNSNISNSSIKMLIEK